MITYKYDIVLVTICMHIYKHTLNVSKIILQKLAASLFVAQTIKVTMKLINKKFFNRQIFNSPAMLTSSKNNDTYRLLRQAEEVSQNSYPLLFYALLPPRHLSPVTAAEETTHIERRITYVPTQSTVRTSIRPINEPI